MSELVLRGPSHDSLFNTRLTSDADCLRLLKSCRGIVHPEDEYSIPSNLLTLCGTKAPRGPDATSLHIAKVCQIEKLEPPWLHEDIKKTAFEGLPRSPRGVFVGKMPPSHYLTTLSHRKKWETSKDILWALSKLAVVKCPVVVKEDFDDDLLQTKYFSRCMTLEVSDSQLRAEAALLSELAALKTAKISPRLLSEEEVMAYSYGRNKAVPEPLSRLRVSLPSFIKLPIKETNESSRLESEVEKSYEPAKAKRTQSDEGPSGRLLCLDSIFKEPVVKSKKLIKEQEKAFEDLVESNMERLPWDLNTCTEITFPNPDQDIMGKVSMPLLLRLDAELPIARFSTRDETIVNIVNKIQSQWHLGAQDWVEQRATNILKSAEGAKSTKDTASLVKWPEMDDWSYDNRISPKTCIQMIWADKNCNPRWQKEGCCEKIDPLEGGHSSSANPEPGSVEKNSNDPKKTIKHYTVIDESDDDEGDEEGEWAASSDVDQVEYLQKGVMTGASSKILVRNSDDEASPVAAGAFWKASPAKTTPSSSPRKFGTRDAPTSSTIKESILIDITSTPLSLFSPYFMSSPSPSRNRKGKNRATSPGPILANFSSPNEDTPSPSGMKRKGEHRGHKDFVEPPVIQKRQRANNPIRPGPK